MDKKVFTRSMCSLALTLTLSGTILPTINYAAEESGKKETQKNNATTHAENLKKTEKAYNEAKKKLEENQKKLKKSQEDLKQAEKALAEILKEDPAALEKKRKQELDKAKKELDQLKANLTKNKAALKTAQSELATAQQKSKKKTDEVNASEKKLTTTKKDRDTKQTRLNTLVSSQKNTSTIKWPKGFSKKTYDDYRSGKITSDELKAILSKGMKENKFISNKDDAAVKVKTMNGLTPAMRRSLTEFAMGLLNSMRKDIGTPQLIATKGAEKLTNDIVNEYNKASWQILYGKKDHYIAGISKAAGLNGLRTGGNECENLSSALAPKATWQGKPVEDMKLSLDELKEEIYNTICRMSFLDQHSGYGHLKSLTSLDETEAETFAAQYDIYGQLHFIVVHKYSIVNSKKYDMTPVIPVNKQAEINKLRVDLPKLADSIKTQTTKLTASKTELSNLNKDLKTKQNKKDTLDKTVKAEEKQLPIKTDAHKQADKNHKDAVENVKNHDKVVAKNKEQVEKDKKIVAENDKTTKAAQKVYDSARLSYEKEKAIVTIYRDFDEKETEVEKAVQNVGKLTTVDSVHAYLDELLNKHPNGWYQDKETKKWYYYKQNKRQKGMQLISKVNYYFNQDGQMVTGWKKIDGKWYHFNSKGYRAKGWKEIRKVWYYFNDEGQMATGWREIKGKWYHFNKNGNMEKNWRKIRGVWYYFNKDGSMAKGWKEIKGIWYHFNKNGNMEKGWKKISGVWYYFNDLGTMTKGWMEKDGLWYHFNDRGNMDKGFRKISGVWYYFNDRGTMTKGWKEVKGVWYHFNKNGNMEKGWKEIKGVWYYFNKDGSMMTGWKDIKGERYHFNVRGNMRKGWLNVKGEWFYFNKSGKLQRDKTLIIKNKIYTFDKNGVWVKR